MTARSAQPGISVRPDGLESGGETAQVLGIEHESQLETSAGEIQWDQPKARLSKARRDFFPQAKALGVDVDQPLSPSMLEKVSYLGVLLKSFRLLRRHRIGTSIKLACAWNSTAGPTASTPAWTCRHSC